MNIPKELIENDIRQAIFQELNYHGKMLTECTKDELIAAVYSNAHQNNFKHKNKYCSASGEIVEKKYAA